jgi:hypothetical protein
MHEFCQKLHGGLPGLKEVLPFEVALSAYA